MIAPRSDEGIVLKNRHDTGLDVVTGAFGYSGRAIARELQERNRRVRTLTGHPGRAEAGSTIETFALDFEDLPVLTESLRGATTLYNASGCGSGNSQVDHNVAVENSRALFNSDATSRRAAHRPRKHYEPEHRLALPLFSWQGSCGTCPGGDGPFLRGIRPAILFGADGV